MKMLLVILTGGLLFGPAICDAAQTAQATMFCWSLRFGQGTGYGGYYLDLTTLSSGINGELAPYDDDTQWSWYEMHDAYYFFDMTGYILVDIPSFTDANGNGFDDFFEVSQGVSATTWGSYSDDRGIGGGTVTAQWSRGAGSPNGTCVLSFEDDVYGSLGDFNHSFELFEYTGPLSYTPGSNTVNGSVNLTQTGNAANQMQGPVQFVKVATNRFNKLTLQAGTWTNAAQQTLTFYEYLFQRDATWPTNYYGLVEYDDGDPNTGEADYQYWVLSVDDLNDRDHDGIPDFSDDPALPPPRQPVLTLTLGTTNLFLTISGDVGHVHQVLEATTVTPTSWQTNQSLTLTNDPQTISLPIPSGPRFWRVSAQ
jgi:hypothetical protein